MLNATLTPPRARSQVAGAVLCLLLLGSFGALAQTPFEVETEFLARDGGRWIAESGTSPEFYGTAYAWDYDENGAPNLMNYEVYGFDAEGDSVQYWQGIAGWNPVTEQVELRQFGSFSFPNEAMGTGTESRLNETTTQIVFALRYRGGFVRTVTDRMIVTGPDSFTSQSFENGQMIAENQWTRVKAPVAEEPSPDAGASTVLRPSYPNPTADRATLRFTLDTAGTIHLDVFDVQGRLVRTLLDKHHEAGTHTVAWDGTDEAGRAVASGVYLYRLRTASGMVTRRMTLVR